MSRPARLISLLLSIGLIFLSYGGEAFSQSPLADANGSGSTVSGSASAKDGGAAAIVSATPAPTGNFFQRFVKAYADDWKQLPSSDAAAPAFRSTPSPVEGPPFPFSDWPYGGSVVITKPWTQSSPLMQALWSGPGGEGWKRSGVQIYGWANVGFNVSSSNKPGYAPINNGFQQSGLIVQ